MKAVDSSHKTSPRVLIITLHTGEQELTAGQEAIERQTEPRVEQIVISGLPNLQAHRALYRTITERSGDFDFFVKLDADMVFQSEFSLKKLLEPFEDPDLDHLVAPVFDVPSDSNIFGIHLYRAGVEWSTYQDAMFTDPNPIIKGRRLILE